MDRQRNTKGFMNEGITWMAQNELGFWHYVARYDLGCFWA